LASNEERNPFAGYIAWLGLTMALVVGGIFLPTSGSNWLFESAFVVNISGTVMSPVLYFSSHRSDHKLKVILITLSIAVVMGLFIVLAALTNRGNGY
jgi:hypothetical protein